MRELDLPQVTLVAGGYQEGVDGPSGTPMDELRDFRNSEGIYVYAISPDGLGVDFDGDGMWDSDFGGHLNTQSDLVQQYIRQLEANVTVGQVSFNELYERAEFYRDAANQEALNNYILQCTSAFSDALGLTPGTGVILGHPALSGLYQYICSNDEHAERIRELIGSPIELQ